MEERKTYSEKLKDPRWQKKRLKILERDNWTCQRCLEADNPLVVHHRLYLFGKEPWEYSDNLLVTLCECCHEKERSGMSDSEGFLLNAVKSKFLTEEFFSLTYGLDRMVLQDHPYIVAHAYGEALADPEMQRILVRNTLKEYPNLKKFHKKG